MKKPRNSKRTIEIYFILYLAALVLLIPDLEQKSIPTGEQSNIDYNIFKIYPDKTILNAKITLDSSGSKVADLDSLNLIYYTGDVSSIDISFQITNKKLGQFINVSNNDNNFDFIKFKVVPDISAYAFWWHPPILDKRNYILDVKAKAKALVRVKDGNRTKLVSMEAQTQFSLIVSYYNQQSGMPYFVSISDSVVNNNDSIFNSLFVQNYSDIYLDFTDRKVQNLTTEEWENKLNVFGVNLNTELNQKPNISISNSPENNLGSVYIKSISNNSITLAGKTPQFGQSKVKVKLTRKNDGASYEDEFIISPMPIMEPIYSSQIQPNQKYKIEPNFPELNNKSYFVKIFTDDKVLYSSSNIAPFYFSAEESFANKTIYFERYINGKLYGKTYNIYVKPFPIPQIVKIQTISNNQLKMVVNSFGSINGRENYIKSVEISGNANYKELLGQASSNKDNLIYTQIFEIAPNEINREFKFKIRMQDQKKQWSNWIEYP